MPPHTRPRTKAEQREETTQNLVEHARELFATYGYAKVSLSQIVTAAGVTKGALYHHFAGKEDLFQAVLTQVHQEVADRVASAAPDADLWTQFIAGCRAFLTASTEPRIQQIMLVDAPSVLGWGVWREIDASTSRQHLEEIVTQLIEQDLISKQPVAPLVHLLSGAMNEAALWLTTSTTRAHDVEATMAALTNLLKSLRT
ncbi:TetR/AcrR family transcriptional regulator [Actinobacteria bacterium YIM 96077]|uniref:TetR/AcrR family transcriptional regulator n=1 Tax=Phytoactinopolyspora halophila TaxID=1981511 RepID=A0A329QTP5_9ACTN|nr:TetR/AcrR family transcriptional regulator [Phytoactinopolyspora halophila]AYY14939.1 TetR/AcrR family transcriptional regulator [Actinobacteria bacterium YIM 96077]RAW15396.1 TetR/AcrR family transcriptional regulator [Phytoactinopolyspora halophila]